jgi:predicted double-glycine peptidase
MNLWLEAAFALMVAATGVALGYWFSRLRKPWWVLGYCIPFFLVMVYGIAVYYPYPALSFEPPISWMMMGRKKFVIVGFIATMLLTTPLSRLPRKRDRMVVILFMIVFVCAKSIWPLLAPTFNRSELVGLKTRIGADGVCLQNTGYTCGPASAVTALRKLGLPAEESQIAILSLTSSATGTPPDLLADALQKYYGKDGLIAEYRAFNDISELKQAGLTLAVIKFDFLVDHYVTVLEVTDTEVVVGDPLNGLDRISFADFRKEWRFVGIVLKRRP